MTSLIPHNQPTLGRLERAAAARVLASRWLAQGAETAAFENEVCEYLGLQPGHAVALSSGTAALFMALWVLQARGKRIAIPVYSCAAVRNAVLMAGAEPVPIDVAPDSPNIDLQKAVAARVDLIVAAHIFGVPSRIEPRGLGVPVVEDCAQSFGAQLDDRPVGVSGTVGIFSFYATKMLTSGGQGGMFVSCERSLVESVRDYRQFDCRGDRLARFNLQMTDLQAAVGRAQLSQLSDFLGRRRDTYERYAAAGLHLWPPRSANGLQSCHYRAVIRTPDPAEAIARFESHGVRAIIPIAEWELLEDAPKVPRAAALARSTVSIPIHPSLTQRQISTIIASAGTLNPLREMEPS